MNRSVYELFPEIKLKKLYKVKVGYYSLFYLSVREVFAYELFKLEALGVRSKDKDLVAGYRRNNLIPGKLLRVKRFKKVTVYELFYLHYMLKKRQVKMFCQYSEKIKTMDITQSCQYPAEPSSVLFLILQSLL